MTRRRASETEATPDAAHHTANSAFTESTLEQAALARLESLGFFVKHGVEVALDEVWGKGAGRADYAYVMLEARLRDALAQFSAVLLPNLISGELRLNGAHRSPETA